MNLSVMIWGLRLFAVVTGAAHAAISIHGHMMNEDGWVALPPTPGPLTIPAVFSLARTAEAVQDKLFALDARYVLRAAPRRQIGKATVRELGTVRRVLRQLWTDRHDYYSYFRRAVRPNEILFPVAAGDRQPLCADLALWGPT